MTDVNLKMLKDTDGNAFVPFSTTDAVFKDGTNQTVSDLLDEKQATLVSGTNIKTINGDSILGAGNITVSAEDEIAISTTEPTGNEILWIDPSNVPSGIGSYISNSYGTSQAIGYSQEYVNKNLTYSTSETDTGKRWIDGKKIYRKVVNFGALPNATSKSVAHGISNLSEVILITGIAKFGTTFSPIPIVYNSNDSAYNVGIDVGSTNVTLSTTQNRSQFTGIITIEYTKSS